MLIGFSLGARVIFYALLELAKQKAFGIVQDVFLLGATVTAPKRAWFEVRGVVAGRLVNGYARNDWVLNYLFRATSGGLNPVAGLRPIEMVPGLENVDVTDKIAGHGSYRAFMPLILDELGFPVSADYFNEPEVRANCLPPLIILSVALISRNPTWRVIAKWCVKEKIQRRSGDGSLRTRRLLRIHRMSNVLLLRYPFLNIHHHRPPLRQDQMIYPNVFLVLLFNLVRQKTFHKIRCHPSQCMRVLTSKRSTKFWREKGQTKRTN